MENKFTYVIIVRVNFAVTIQSSTTLVDILVITPTAVGPVAMPKSQNVP